MKTSTYQSWWREMGAIGRGMMFIEGNIATPAALDRAEQGGYAPTPATPPSPQRETRPEPGRRTFSLYEELLFLGGRPMTPGHNDDLDEPFPQTYAEPQYRSHRFGERRRSQATQPQHCATC